MKSYCILCGNELTEDEFLAKDFISGVPGEFRYCRCSVCRSYIQTPVPSQEFLTSCYESHTLHYQKPVKERDFCIFSRPIVRIVRHLWRKLERKHPIMPLVSSVPATPPPAKLLEIGCGYGQYLNERKMQGYDVTGVELNEESCRCAQECHGLTLINDLVENLVFPENSFDIAVANMVLEHLRDPRKILERLYEWLKKDGELIISVPTPEGFAFERFGKLCYVIHPPYHLSLFTLEGIRCLADGLFEVSEYQYQFIENDLCRSAVFAKSVEPTLYNRFFAFTNRFPLLRLMVRFYIYKMVQKGGKWSRISVRLKCVK